MPMPWLDHPLPESVGRDEDAVSNGPAVDQDESSSVTVVRKRESTHRDSTHAVARLLSEVLTVHEREVMALRAELSTMRAQSHHHAVMEAPPMAVQSPRASPRGMERKGSKERAGLVAALPKPGDVDQPTDEDVGEAVAVESMGLSLSEPLRKSMQQSWAKAGCNRSRTAALRETNAQTAKRVLEDHSLAQDISSASIASSRAGKRPASDVKHQTASSLAVILRTSEKTDKLERFVDGAFDKFVSILIMLNVVFVCFQLEYYGYGRGVRFGVPPAGLWPWSGGDQFFYVAEHIFNALFLVELLFRIVVFRTSFLVKKGRLQKANIFDGFLVGGSSLDLYYASEREGGSGLNLNVLRPFRFLRLLRTLRVLQTVKVFEKLRELVTTVIASFMALFWSIVLLTIVMLMASLFLCQSLTVVLDDQVGALATQEWVFLMYGTTSRSFYTVFELTFSGGWPNYARNLVEDVHWAYAVFFFVYIIAVTFAMFRIITTLFLRDTLALASNDAEAAVQEKIKQKQGYANKLLDFFYTADASDDGYLTLDEFELILSDEKVKTWLSIMEIDVHETTEFFNILADGDGLVSAEEFVQGILRLKGGARSQDVMAIQRSAATMQSKLSSLLELCAQMDVEIKSLKHAGKGPAAR